MHQKVVKISRRNFKETVLAAEVPVVVMFSGSAAPPSVAKTFSDVAGTFKAEIAAFGWVDTSADPEMITKHEIQVWPTFIIFRGGQPVWRFEGILVREGLAQLLAAELPAAEEIEANEH